MDISIYDQLVEWVNGNPTHNKKRDECCPDFSCCFPQHFEKDRKFRMQYAIEVAKGHGLVMEETDFLEDEAAFREVG